MVKNRTIFTGDNLPIMRGMADETVDLIYLDPPFNSNKYYEAPIGSKAEGASFKDVWRLTDTDLAWWGEIADVQPKLYTVIEAIGAAGGGSNMSYSIYMATRLLEMHRILKNTGSIYYHCDPTMSHSVKLMMDTIFGGNSFRNEIVWCYTGPGSPGMRQFNRKHDIILWYSKGAKWAFNSDDVRIPYKGGKPHVGGYGMDKDDVEEYGKKGKVPETWWEMRIAPRSTKEYTGYPTQKPLELLRRIVRASSNEGDMVLDPFCGCATACVAAEDEGREWIGIDVSELAFNIVKERLHKPREEGGIGSLFANAVIHLDKPPKDKNVKRSRDIKHTLYGQQEGKCNGCLMHFQFRNLEVDHIIPASKGGSGDDSNKQLLCGACNRKKGANDMPYLVAQLRREGLR